MYMQLSLIPANFLPAIYFSEAHRICLHLRYSRNWKWLFSFHLQGNGHSQRKTILQNKVYTFISLQGTEFACWLIVCKSLDLETLLGRIVTVAAQLNLSRA